MLSETTLNLSIGEGKLLTVKNNSSNVVWTSENPAVATVAAGYVEAVSAGKTIVYAIIGEEVLTCEVIVSENDIVTTTGDVTTTSKNTTTTTKTVTTTIPSTTQNPETIVTTISDVPIVTTDISTTTAPVTTTEITTTTVDTNIFDIKEVDGGIIIIDCDTLVVNVTVPVEINGVEIIKINDYVFSSSDLKTITFDNPNVIITDSETTINEKTVIFGYTGSTAEAYAEKYDRIFVSLDEDDKPDYLQGDITGDGLINLYDAIDICKYIMGMKKLTEDEEAIADFDENGVVDLYDAIGIAKKLLE